MSESYVDLLRVVVGALTVRVRGEVFWRGTLLPRTSSAATRSLPPEALRTLVRSEIRDCLYRGVYLTGMSSIPAGSRPAGDVADFRAALSAANAGRGTWDRGWIVHDARDDTVVVERGGFTLTVPPRELEVGNRALAPGDDVALFNPSLQPALLPHFLLLRSNAPFTQSAATTMTRVYLNVTPSYAAALVHEFTTRLNAAELRFQLKLLSNPAHYTRCDAAVLYLMKEDWEVAGPMIADLYAAIAGGVMPGTPAFTKQLAPGLGMAEDPGEDLSFGQHRCGLLAEGITRAWERGQRRFAHRLRAVNAVFDEAGIDWERPYLNPDSTDVYTLEHAKTTCVWSAATLPIQPGAGLRAASGIGRQIVSEAFWHDDRCTWLGGQRHHLGQSQSWATLGPDLYDGAAGVALFLAHLHAAIGDADLRRTALGAIRQAIARADDVPRRGRLGAYTGWPGIALATTRIGILLDEPSLITDARSLIGRLNEMSASDHEHDLLSGSAGAILALLTLRRLVGDDDLLTRAVQLGDRLLAAADRDEHGLSWPSPSTSPTQHLTGLSHGAAGIGLALFKLGALSGADRFSDAGRGAFAWERQWLNAAEGNWPDFRGLSRRSRSSNATLPYATYWCHGAPGIALSRLLVWQLLGDDCLRDEAVLALETTRQSVRTALAHGFANFSLCHGLTGNAEILRIGHEILGGGDPLRQSLVALVEEVAAFGLRYYASGGQGWPTGSQGATTPGLMLGTAGIGMFYLRMAGQPVPTVLLDA